MISAEDLAFDATHIWHPYTSLTSPLPVYGIESAQGCELTLSDGRVLIDGMASWWACIHGYNHPRLNAAIADQLSKMSHVMFGGITHQPAIDLAKLLVEITPDALETVFFSDSGSIAIEVALKMALQYWVGGGKRDRNQFVTVRGGYHGDTYHAMSVCDPIGGMHSLFASSLPKYLFADRPKIQFNQSWNESDFESLRSLVIQNSQVVAAIVLEPIVQGAGGMYFYHPTYLRRVRELCDEVGCLLILDEIATGFGRSGRLFAMEYGDVVPDILCLGKALTGGYMTLGATMTTRAVANGISAGGVLMHGPTFMGNPLACRVALESLRLLLSMDWLGEVKRIEAGLRRGLEAARGGLGVADVRVLGAIGVVEMNEPVDVAVVQRELVQRGVWVRPFGKLVYVMPPFCISDKQLVCLTRAIVEVCEL
ncbi:MAG: adenosylmethionine--8-amino-7-oxononanoate transaminase [Cyanobacteria bacterium]|nr:adenosylmethionine--8-amino-7-oxononanoate transaminase [Cyanobacteriota bacterium]